MNHADKLTTQHAIGNSAGTQRGLKKQAAALNMSITTAKLEKRKRVLFMMGSFREGL